MAYDNSVISEASPGLKIACVDSAFIDYYRCPIDVSKFESSGTPSADAGFFRFGEDTVCFGHLTSGTPFPFVTDVLHDAMAYVAPGGEGVHVPFRPSEVI